MSENKITSEALSQEIRNMNPQHFEELISDLWEYLGYETEVSKGSGDRGVDVVAKRDFPYEEKVVIQAKRWNSTVGGPDIREYIAQVERDDVDSVIVIGTAGFTKSAKEDAERYGVKLINGNTLANMFLDEGVVDLVKKYTGDITAQVQQKRSPSHPSGTEQEVRTTVGEGEYLQIEIVGYSFEKFRIWGTADSPTTQALGTESREGLTVVLLEITNKSTSEWEFRPEDHLSVISEEGYSYTDALGSYDDIGPWTTGSASIKRNSKSRIALIYDTGGPITPKRLEYSAEIYYVRKDVSPGDEEGRKIEEITIPVDESVHRELNTLPDSFRVDAARVILTTHPDFEG